MVCSTCGRISHNTSLPVRLESLDPTDYIDAYWLSGVGIGHGPSVASIAASVSIMLSTPAAEVFSCASQLL